MSDVIERCLVCDGAVPCEHDGWVYTGIFDGVGLGSSCRCLAEVDEILTLRLGREPYGPRPDLCPNCKSAKSAWGRYGCDHSKWGPGVPDFRGLPELYRSWTPRGSEMHRSDAVITGVDWGFAESRTVCATVAIGSDKKTYINGDDYIATLKRNEVAVRNALRLPAHLVGGPARCECGFRDGIVPRTCFDMADPGEWCDATLAALWNNPPPCKCGGPWSRVEGGGAFAALTCQACRRRIEGSTCAAVAQAWAARQGRAGLTLRVDG